MDIALRISFLILSNIKINFLKRKLNLRSYTTIETLPTTKQIKLVEKKKFIVIALDLNNEIFIIHVAFLICTNVYLFHKAQIALLIHDNAPIVVLSKYVDFANVFSHNLVAKLLEYIGINDYLINLVKSQ